MYVDSQSESESEGSEGEIEFRDRFMTKKARVAGDIEKSPLLTESVGNQTEDGADRELAEFEETELDAGVVLVGGERGPSAMGENTMVVGQQRSGEEDLQPCLDVGDLGDAVLSIHPVGSRFSTYACFFFVTYPRCPIEHFKFMAALRTSVRTKIQWSVIGRETHQDGSFHLHALLRLHRRHRITDQSFFDLNGDGGSYHGHIQAVRSRTAVFRYCTKGGLYCVWGVPEDTVRGQCGVPAKKHDVPGVAKKKLRQNELMHEILTKMVYEDADPFTLSLVPEYCLMVISNLSKLQYVATTLRNRIQRPDMEFDHAEYDLVDHGDVNTANAKIVEWCNENLKNIDQRPLRSKALYLRGDHEVGKTHFVEELKRMFRVYKPVRNEDFWDFYDDESFEVIFFEEFYNSRTMQQMNEIIDGTEMTLRVKGGQRKKRRNLPVILASNKFVDDLYQDARQSMMRNPDYEAFCSRLVVVEVPNVKKCINIRLVAKFV